MSIHYTSDSLERIYSHFMGVLLHEPDFESAPRGKPIKELVAASFTLTDPRNRLVLSPARAANYGFGVGELCWYLRGDTDLATMLYYNKRMKAFSDDGTSINSAYGARMFNEHGATDVRPSQFTLCVEELKRDPDSRRAVMHINQPADLRRAVSIGSKDVPCTMSLQLLIRNRRLHMHVLLRSNDVCWGVPYDVFSFTCLQEAFLYMLQEVGVPVDDLGYYHHTAGSLHIYDTHYSMAKQVSEEKTPDTRPMAPFTLVDLQRLADEDEPVIRANRFPEFSPEPCRTSDGLWKAYDVPHTVDTTDWMMCRLHEHRNKRTLEEQERARKDAALTELTRLTEELGGYATEQAPADGTGTNGAT